MTDRTYLSWPFLEDRHRALADEIDRWAMANVEGARSAADEDTACRTLVSALGRDGFLRYVVPDGAGESSGVDVRSICIIRETLARHWSLADFSYAMQGLGSAPVWLSGSEELRGKYLPGVADGTAICGFALSEKEAGSNVAATALQAQRDGGDFVLDGEKTWISNAGVADFYTVFARTGEAEGAKGISAFVVDADAPGLDVRERIALSAPHPLGTLRFSACRVPAANRLGHGGDGFGIAMSTLDIYRATVGAAALGFARRALDESVRHAAAREVIERPLVDFQMTQQKLADMACAVDASALVVYRAAWAKDSGAERVTREASIAKLFATEAAQRVIDDAVQLFGGMGVVSGHPVEQLYRDIRPLRIYEGTSEIQRIVISREIMKGERAE